MATQFDPTKYGGTFEEETPTDMFAKFGGEAIDTKPAEDMFAKFGGRRIEEPDKTPVEEPGDLEEDKLQEIADSHQVPVEAIKAGIPFLSGVTGGYVKGQEEDIGSITTRVVGELSKQAGFGIPQKAYILSQEKNLRDALDATRDYINSKRTIGQRAAEFGLGLVVPGGVVKQVGKGLIGKVAGAATTGAIYGATMAKTGEEAESAVANAAFMGALFGAPMAAYKGYKALNSKTITQATEYATLNKIETKADEIAQKNQPETQERLTIFSSAENVDKLVESYKVNRRRFRELSSALKSNKTPAEYKEGIKNELEKLAPMILKQEGIVNEMQEFAGHLSRTDKTFVSKKAATVLKEAADRESEFVGREYTRFRGAKAYEEALVNSIEAQLPQQRSWLRGVKEWLVDGTIMARNIDREVAGSRMSVTMDKMAKDKRAYDIRLASALYKAKEIKSALTQANIADDLAYKIMDNVDLLAKNGEEMAVAAGLSSSQAKVLRQVRNEYDIVKNEMETLGLKMGTIKAYIPHIRVSSPETIRRINKEAEKAEINLQEPEKTAGIDDFLEEYAPFRDYLSKAIKPEKPEGLDEFMAANGPMLNVVRGLEYIAGGKIENATSFGIAFRTSQNIGTLNKLAISESARAMQRTLDMPDFLREKNIAKLFQAWNSDTLRHIYFRDGLGELNAIRKIAISQNKKDSARYIDTLIKDLTGLREGTGLEWTRRSIQNAQLHFKKMADQHAEGTFQNKFYEALAETPEIFGLISSQVYPNLLGLSARAMITNLTSPITMGIPELGGAYGAKKILEAGINTLWYLRNGREVVVSGPMAKYFNTKGFKGRIDYIPGEKITVSGLDALTIPAINTGHMGPQYSSELFRAVEGGIKDSAIYDMSIGALEKWNTFAMAGFEFTEKLIRNMMLDTGESVAKDIMSKTPGAINFLNKMDRAYRKEIDKAIQLGNQEEVKTLVANYLVGRTLFNYDRISMSQFGRSMGPIFSVFAKWPATIGGDIIDRVEEKGMKGVRENIIKYMGPLAFLLMLDNMMQYMEIDPKNSPVAYQLLGQQGLSGMAPVNSISPLLDGGFARPPVVRAAADLVIATANGDPQAVWKWANQTTQYFMPGSSLLRALTQDLPVFMGEERVEGPFLERAYKRVTGER